MAKDHGSLKIALDTFRSEFIDIFDQVLLPAPREFSKSAPLQRPSTHGYDITVRLLPCTSLIGYHSAFENVPQEGSMVALVPRFHFVLLFVVEDRIKEKSKTLQHPVDIVKTHIVVLRAPALL
jgi:hypothetical protein